MTKISARPAFPQFSFISPDRIILGAIVTVIALFFLITATFVILFVKNYLQVGPEPIAQTPQATQKPEFIELQLRKIGNNFEIASVKYIDEGLLGLPTGLLAGLQIDVVKDSKNTFRTFILPNAALIAVVPFEPESTILIRDIKTKEIKINVTSEEIVDKYLQDQTQQSVSSPTTSRLSRALEKTVNDFSGTFSTVTPKKQPEQPPSDSDRVEKIKQEIANIAQDKPKIGDWLIHQTSEYKIEYVPSVKVFFVTITQSPFETHKRQAEEWFKKYGLSSQDLCKVKIIFVAPPEIKDLKNSPETAPTGC